MDIGKWVRLALGVMAVGLAVSAAAATVEGRELVAVALIAGGILFVLGALTGRLPFEVTVGGVGAKYHQNVQKDIARAIAEHEVSFDGQIIPKRGKPHAEPDSSPRAE